MSTQWPDLAVLELLVGVADGGSLGAAARAVGMAQPNASRAVAALERSLGVTLLVRHPRGARLTDEGAVMVERSRDVLDAARGLLATAEALGTTVSPHVRVAASMTVAEHLMPGWLLELRHVLPGVEARMQVLNSAQVLAAVAAGTYEIGFIEAPGAIPRGLRSRTVAADKLVVVVPPGHPWATRRTPVTADELARTPLLVREVGSGTRDTLARALAAHPMVAPVMELGSNAAVRVGVRVGTHPAVLSELAVASDLAHGELVAVPVEGLDLARRIRAVWRGPRLHGAAAGLVATAGRPR